MNAEAQGYWDGKAAELTFTHPLNLDWFADLPKQARILDYGCGYGRTLVELRDAGWRNSVGVDFSGGLIERGRHEHADLKLCTIGATRLDEPDDAFDAALLFAVLTCMPDDAEQLAVIGELKRLLAPRGWLYLSDYLLQDDARHLKRYRAGAASHGVYGVWDRGDGAVFRHHTHERLERLLAGFEVIAERQVEIATLSGARAIAIQVLARRSVDG